MKARVLSFAIALIALFAFNNAFAQGSGNPHFVGQVCFDQESGIVSGKIAGVGSDLSTITVRVTGDYGCLNPGGKKMPKPWSYFEITAANLTQDPNNPGQYFFCQSLESYQVECHVNGWTAVFRNLRATVIRGNKSNTTNISTTCANPLTSCN